MRTTLWLSTLVLLTSAVSSSAQTFAGRALSFGAPGSSNPWNPPEAELHEAASRGELAVVRSRVAAGSHVGGQHLGEPVLTAAARGGHVEVVRFLLREGALDRARSGYTGLHVAALRGHAEVVKALLDGAAGRTDFSAYRDARTPWNETALYLAALKGHAGVVRVLLAEKADRSVRADDSRTALEAAVDPTVRALLR